MTSAYNVGVAYLGQGHQHKYLLKAFSVHVPFTWVFGTEIRISETYYKEKMSIGQSLVITVVSYMVVKYTYGKFFKVILKGLCYTMDHEVNPRP